MSELAERQLFILFKMKFVHKVHKVGLNDKKEWK